MIRRPILILFLALAGLMIGCTSPSSGGGATGAPASGAPATQAPTTGGYSY